MRELPNLAETCLAEVIRRIGLPGFEAALWSYLSDHFSPDNIIILAYGTAGPPAVLFSRITAAPVFAQLEATYLAGAYRLDPFFDLHLQRVAAGAYRISDIAPDAFQRSRYFVEYYDQTGLIDEITFVAYPSAGISLNICLGRDSTSRQIFSPQEITLCQRLAPVLAALAEAHWAKLARASGPAEDTAALLAEVARVRLGIHLSPRQAEVALMILRGHSTMSIGLRLGLSAQTIKVFRRQLYARCNISSQAELFGLMLPLMKDDGMAAAGASRVVVETRDRAHGGKS